MCMTRLDECDCDHHKGKCAKHILPCCDVCPKCGYRVKWASIKTHAAQHTPAVQPVGVR